MDNTIWTTEFLSVIVAGVSAIISTAGAIVSAIIANRGQRRVADRTTFIRARMEAYSDLEFAIRKISSSPSNEALTEFYRAANCASLIAGDETTYLLGQMLDFVHSKGIAVNKEDADRFVDLHAHLNATMKNDLIERSEFTRKTHRKPRRKLR